MSVTLSHINAKINSSQLTESEKLKIQKAVREFESIFVSQMLKTMRGEGMETTGIFDEEEEGLDAFGDTTMQSLFDMEIAKSLSRSQSLGIADSLYKKLTGENLPNHLPIYPTNSFPNIEKVKTEKEIISTTLFGREKNNNNNIALKKIEQEFKPISKTLREVPGIAKTVAEKVNEFDDIIKDAEKKFSIDENIIKAIIAAESNGNSNAISPKKAKGVMQLIDATAKTMGVKNIFDPRENIFGGTKYLRQMLDKFDGNLDLALASYNAGPGAVQKYGGIPPYKETQNYVKRVFNFINYFGNFEK